LPIVSRIGFTTGTTNLVERAPLFAAVNTLDGDKKRGLLLIE
jgi:hypothetical protein